MGSIYEPMRQNKETTNEIVIIQPKQQFFLTENGFII